MKRPMAVIGITFLAALVLLGLTGAHTAYFLLIASAVSLIISLVIKKVRQAAVFPAVILSVSAACLLFILQTEYTYKPALALATDNQVKIEGAIVDFLGKNENGTYRYIVKTTKIDGKPKSVKIRLSCDALQADYYDKISFSGKLYEIGSGSREIHQYYKSSGIYLGSYTYGKIIVSKTSDKPFYYHFIKLRESFADTIAGVLPGNEGAVLSAMLLGVRSNLSDDIYSDFTDTGVLHIFSVSGMHTSILSMFIYTALRRTRLKNSRCAFISAVFILMYMALTAFTPTVLRAGIMTLLLFGGLIFKKESDSLNSLGIAAVLITFANPFSATNIGLILSFLSTLGIVTLYPRFSERARQKIYKIRYRLLRRTASWASDILIISAVAILFTLPAMLLYFGSISVIAPLTNLLVIDASGLAIILSGIAVIFAAVPYLSILKYPLLLIAGLLAKYIIWCVNVLAKIPFAVLSLKEDYWALWLAASLILTAAAILLKGDFHKKFRLTAILSVLILLSGMLSYSVANKNITTVSVISVGNGSSVLLSRAHHGVLIGCGGDYYAASSIGKALNENSVKTLDIMLIPRITETEMSAFSEISSQYDSQKLVAPAVVERTDTLISKKNAELIKRADISLWNDVTISYENSGDVSYAYTAVGHLKILSIFYPASDLSKIPADYLSADILICRASVPKGLEYRDFGIIIISDENERGEKTAQRINAQGGNCVAVGAGGLTIKTRGNSDFTLREAG